MAFGIRDTRKSSSSEDSGRGHASDHKRTVDQVIYAVDCSRDVVEQIRQTGTREELTSLGHEYIESHPEVAYSVFKHTKDKRGAYALLEQGYPELAVEVFRIVGDKEGFEKAMAKIEETDPQQAGYLRSHYESITRGVKRAIGFIRHRGSKRNSTSSGSHGSSDSLQGRLLGKL